MAKPIVIDKVRITLIKEIDAALRLVASVHSLPRSSPHPNAPAGLHPSHVTQVAELAFMGMVAAWEEFLEHSLVRYVAGAATNTGHNPQAKVGFANSIGEAYSYLSQNPKYDPAKHYLKVTDYKWVIKTADFHFSSHTYGCMTPHLKLLEHAVKIRNRVAHASVKCKQEFIDVAKLFKQPQNNVLPQGFTVGKFLFEIAIAEFPPQYLNGQTYFSAYANLYKDLANQIVP